MTDSRNVGATDSSPPAASAAPPRAYTEEDFKQAPRLWINIWLFALTLKDCLGSGGRLPGK
jgi:hypothetical protein